MSVVLKIQTPRGAFQGEVQEGVEVLASEVERVDPDYPFGCRAASCGVCRAHVIEGVELLGPVTLMEEDTLERCGVLSSHRLMCRAMLKEGAAGVLTIRPEE